MDDPSESILERLESAVRAWTTEVDEAQRRLTEQLAGARARVAPADTAAEHALESALGEQFAGLQRILEECMDATRDVLARIGTLERDVDTLKGQVAEARSALEAVRQPVPTYGEAAPTPSGGERGRKVPIHPFDDRGAPRRMGEILVDAGLLTHEQLESALEVQRRAPQRKLGSILVEQGFTSEEVVPQVLARQLRIPYVRLNDETLDPAAAALITGRLAAQHASIPVRASGNGIALAMANPLDLVAIDDIERATGRRVQPLVARESEILSAIAKCYGPGSELQ